MTEAIRPYRINVSDEVLADLRVRLQRTRWPDDYVDHDWDLGTDQTYLKSLCTYWADGYDWRAREAALNAWPHFVTMIDGLDVHFLHVKSGKPNAIPLMIVHGWPGSFVEMLKIIPMLTNPAAFGHDPSDAFDVVVPSIPGFGLSGRPLKAGTNPLVIGNMFAALMQRLGYARFATQGGDFGSNITIWMARNHPDKVIGLHLNLITTGLQFPKGELIRNPPSEREKALLDSHAIFAENEGGYNHIQRTKPQTLGYGLSDSPAGLAAWIVEKFRTWSDCGGDVESVFSRDELLDNIALYWFTGTITSSVRLYREAARTRIRLKEGEKVIPPLGFALFPKEIALPPREWAERYFNVRRWTEMPRGGHFAAMEQPELLADDVKAFFRPFRASL